MFGQVESRFGKLSAECKCSVELVIVVELQHRDPTILDPRDHEETVDPGDPLLRRTPQPKRVHNDMTGEERNSKLIPPIGPKTSRPAAADSAI